MLKKVLVANRGEIALRIMKTAANLGVETVAIHSSDDAACAHVAYADESAQLDGPGVAGYLNIENIIRIAREAGCDCVHPGYGFLSERADFARACRENGLTFIGPDASSLEGLGDKVAARRLARAAKIPVIEGMDAVASAADVHAFFGDQGGAPLMIKAVNGGGGRGIRIVREGGEIDAAVAQCRAEAKLAFGDDALYVERFLPSVRHIEVQIAGDGQDVVHLWERDCTIQRRNQKIVELAPAPNLDPKVRRSILAAAIRIGRANHYKNLGTVEFLVETGAGGQADFFFIETNPRIQVEHTITEEVTGRDLVEIQFLLASGQTLAEIGLTQDAIGAPKGLAVQARINMETLAPDGTITPSGGTLSAFQPACGPGIRVDTYGYPGYRTNPNFDSLLAKLIVHVRSDDLRKLFIQAERALSEFHVEGLKTNIEFLRTLFRLPALQDWAVSVRGMEAQLQNLYKAGRDGLRQRFMRADTSGTTDRRVEAEDYPEGAVAILVPMQAMVTCFSVVEGQVFEAGDELAVVEAMKMQHSVRAETAGVVLQLLSKPGDVLGAHQALMFVEERESSGADREESAELDPDHIRPDLQALRDRLMLTHDKQRPKAVERRRRRKQLTARENIANLCDGSEFVEYGQLVHAAQRGRRSLEDLRTASPADGIVAGVGAVNEVLFGAKRTQCALLAYDATVMAGTQGILGHHKTDRILEIAGESDLPIIFFTEGGGGRPNDDDYALVTACSLDVTTFRTFARHAKQVRITVNSGFCFAGNAVIFGSGDIKIAARNSWIGLAGPAMIEAGGLGSHGPRDIGPATVQAETGLVDILVEDEAEAAIKAKQMLSYFQGALSNWTAGDQRKLRHLVPENRKRVYDVRSVISLLADDGSLIETKPLYALGMITGFMRVEGKPLGFMANNPMHLGGAIDADASDKAAHFLNLCGRYGVPVLSLCDTPGFMVGPESEKQGGVQKAGEFLFAGANFESPLFFVCLRKGYGLGAQAMAGGDLRAPLFTISWPTGEFGPMGLEGSIELGYKAELDAQPDLNSRTALFEKLVAEAYERGHALNVAALNEIDAVVDPKDTRAWISKGLLMAGE